MTALLAAIAALAAFLHQDGVSRCYDGDRYTSCRPQPTPFARRFCRWDAGVLSVLTWFSLLAVSACLGSWQRALLFVTLPGAWFVATHPTCVDAVGIWGAMAVSLLMPAHPILATALSLVIGHIHERGPVFAAIYAWHPLPLLGLLGVAWWRRGTRPDTLAGLHEQLVGHTTLGAIRAHRPHQDILAWEPAMWALRGMLPLAAWLGTSPAGWCALAVAYASRVLGTDTGRFMFWAAPAVLLAMPDPPTWAVALHVLTFRRMV